MGEKGNDGGQFFTPREIIRAMVQVISPQIGATVYDPCCGTGGFLAQAYEYMVRQAGDNLAPDQSETLKQPPRTRKNLICRLRCNLCTALANNNGTAHLDRWRDLRRLF
jgi:type I restriction enzyme M protein